MQRNLGSSLAIGLGLTLSIPALAQSPEPNASIDVGGQSYNIGINQNNGNYSIPDTSLALSDGSVVGVSGVVLDTDPAISYTFSVSNPSPTPQTYNFDLVIPVTPTNIGPIFASLNGSLTDGGSGGPLTVTNSAFPFLQRATAVDSGGIDHSLGLDVGPNKSFNANPSQTYTYSGVSASGTSTFIIYALDVHLSFTLSGNGDSASFNGLVRATGTPAQMSITPEPGSLALLAAFGVCGSGLITRRRNRR